MKKLVRTLCVLGVLGLAPMASGEELDDQAYGVMLSMLAYDESYPLHVRTVGKLDKDSVVWERLVFDSFLDGPVPGLLALPEERKKPYPVVLLLHGLTDNKSSWLEDGFSHGSRVAQGLLEKGYAVMALDAQYHGDRSVLNDYVNPGEMVFERGWGVRYRNLLVQTVIDYRRTLDYISTREDLDESRVGILGYSMGGHMTFLLAASDARIKTVVSCVIPETPGFPMDAATFVRGLENKPLLMLMAEHDQFYTVESAQRLFDSIKGDNKSIRFYNSGHSLPEAYAAEAVTWIVGHL